MSLSKSSPAKRRANRLNALHSTGPKSQQGKARSAMNSKKHGLSTPLNLSPDDPKTSAIMTILQAEGYDETQSYEITICILEYDRVMKAIRNDYLRNSEVDESMLYDLKQLKELPSPIVIMTLNSMMNGKALPVDRIRERLTRIEAKTSRRHHRYLRRTSAQLTKAIRRG